jgi:4-amino-4-deoxy-L-arabinose transferase-like glycosyltransferase
MLGRTLRPDLKVFLLLGSLSVALRLLAGASLEMTSVESYLWRSSREPALGYYDYPGMCAWLIAGTTALLGDSLVAVRLPFVLCGAGTAGFLHLVARRLYGPGPGLLALLLGLVLPLFAVYGTLATPDAPLLFFWSAALWALFPALEGSTRHWVLAGSLAGLAMQSKYTAVFLPLGVLLHLLGSAEHRPWLRRPGPWLAGLAALAAFSPTLAWNALNGWESFLYQGVQRFSERGFRARDLAEWPLHQLLWLTPVVVLLAWRGGFRVLLRWHASAPGERLLAATGLPMLLFFAALLLVRPVRGHWAAAAYVSLLPLALVRRNAAVNATAVVLVVAGLVLPAALPLTPESWRSGWYQLASGVAERKVPDFVVARDYHVASQLGWQFRRLGTPCWDFTPLGLSSKSFGRWWVPGALEGRNAVVLHDARGPHPGEEALLRSRFREVGPLEEVRVTRFGGKQEVFHLQRCTGYLDLSVPR